jgi:hypothetical protein
VGEVDKFAERAHRERAGADGRVAGAEVEEAIEQLRGFLGREALGENSALGVISAVAGVEGEELGDAKSLMGSAPAPGCCGTRPRVPRVGRRVVGESAGGSTRGACGPDFIGERRLRFQPGGEGLAAEIVNDGARRVVAAGVVAE